MKLIGTAAAATAANFIWHSANIGGRSSPLGIDSYNIMALMAFGIVLAVPLDRLIQ